jgi:hypothetical protein
MRARTIGQIISLIAEHMGAKRSGTSATAPATEVPAPKSASTEEVNLDALSDDDIDALLGDDAASTDEPDAQDAVR